MRTDDLENLYLCYDLYKPVKYSAFKWQCYPKRYFSIQHWFLLQRIKDGGQSVAILALIPFLVSTPRNKTANIVVCALTRELVIFMSF